MSDNRLSTVNTVAAVIVAAVTIFGGAYVVFNNIDNKYARKDNLKINAMVERYDGELDDLKEKNEKEIESISNDYKIKMDEVLSGLKERVTASEDELQTVIDDGRAAMETSLNAARTDTTAILSLRTSAKSVINELKNEKQNVIRVSGISQNGPNEADDKAVLKSRNLAFEKMEENSVLKVTYTDVFRVTQKTGQPANQACRWLVHVGENGCKDKPIFTDRHDGKSSDVHSAGVISGYCESVPAGTHEISVEVMPRPHKTGYKDPDCYTGWNTSTWSIEVVEFRTVH